MYLDHAATARYHPLVRSFLCDLPPLLPNASSSHKAGMQIRREVDAARKVIADAIGVYPEEIYFTGSATEANALVTLGLLSRGHVITSEVEHSSMEQNLLLAQNRGVRITRLPLVDGMLSTEQVLEAVEEDTRLVSIMSINNEVGHRFALEGLEEELQRRNIHFHRDAVQSLGKYPFHARNLKSAVFSPHKYGSLEGVGILYLHRDVKLPALYGGGGHEKGLRSGTHNVPAILSAGFVLEAILPHMESYEEKVRAMRSEVLRAGEELGASSLSLDSGSAYVLNLTFPDLPAEVIVNALSAEGIYISAGSACSSAGKSVSRVIRGFTDDPMKERGAVRLSFSPFDSLEDVTQACQKMKEVITELRRGIF
ncbi:MAG TPA: aminotransferase class V-fold PLP-dependent enzyme [Tissierellia bacterium]|nr:aminotransferase class V-fold PLP-dependent enzyme [Tissierellia bacterium]